MLLAIDIGNSNTVCGLFDNGQLTDNEVRFETEKRKTKEHYSRVLSDHFENRPFTSVAISSVVPELDNIFKDIFNKQYSLSPLFVSTTLKSPIPNLTEKDTPLGADRLCDIVAAVNTTKDNRIVVDLGTATKFEVISEENEYLGGAIAPGVGDSYTSLLSHASKLPDLALSSPDKVVGGFDTAEHLNSGYVFGFASLVDGMVAKIKKEMAWESTTVFLTGGFTDLISPHLVTSVTINKTLTLQGIRLLWELNKKA